MLKMGIHVCLAVRVDPIDVLRHTGLDDSGGLERMCPYPYLINQRHTIASRV